MKQTEVSKTVEKKNRREGRGRVLALSRHVYRLQGKDTYYVESETCDSRFYFVRYEPTFHWCSCPDNSTRSEKCKHIFSIEFAIRFNTLKEVDRFPPEVHIKNVPAIVANEYKNESIRTLNDLEKAEIEAEEYRTRRVLTYESDDYSF